MAFPSCGKTNQTSHEGRGFLSGAPPPETSLGQGRVKGGTPNDNHGATSVHISVPPVGHAVVLGLQTSAQRHHLATAGLRADVRDGAKCLTVTAGAGHGAAGIDAEVTHAGCVCRKVSGLAIRQDGSAGIDVLCDAHEQVVAVAQETKGEHGTTTH